MDQRKQTYNLNKGETLSIGRSADCNITVDSVNVALRQGRFERTDDGAFFRPIKSSVKTYFNDAEIRNQNVQLKDGDCISFGNIRVIASNNASMLEVFTPIAGDYLSVRGLTCGGWRMDGIPKRHIILDNVYVDIPEGSLVAILGKTGSGKTTFMDAVIGYRSIQKGEVRINGIDAIKNKDILSSKIGYVPQTDLFRGTLTLNSTLKYIAKLRLQKDITNQEIQERIDKTLSDLKFNPGDGKKNMKVLSGGEKKRASIAQELISEPQIIFLDEPTSGLDPHTETELVNLLRSLSKEQGKTLIAITHTIKNINQYDKIIFFGPGGRLCFDGSPEELREYFGVEEIEDAYPIVEEHAKELSEKCREKYKIKI